MPHSPDPKPAPGRIAVILLVDGEAPAAALHALKRNCPPGSHLVLFCSPPPVAPPPKETIDGVRWIRAQTPPSNPAEVVKATVSNEWVGDVVLLRPEDTAIPWLVQRLQRVAYAAPDIGMVLPASAPANPCEAVDVPEAQLKDPVAMDALCYAASDPAYWDSSEGFWHCAYLKAEAVKVLLSATDRAASDHRRAFSNTSLRLVQCNHVRAATVGVESQEIPSSEAPAISPSYPAVDLRPVQLHITHSWGGGIERFLRDFANADEERINLILRAAGDWQSRRYGERLELYLAELPEVPVKTWWLPSPIASTAASHAPYRRVIEYIVARFRVQTIVVSSLVGHSLDILRTALPTACVYHDYYPQCPAFKSFFNEVCPVCDEDRLRDCLERNPYNALFGDRNAKDWLQLRQQYWSAIASEHIHMVAACPSVPRQVRRLEPASRALRFSLIPHGIKPLARPGVAVTRPAGTPLAVVVLGSLAQIKGLDLLQEALSDLLKHAEIHLLGCGKEARHLAANAGVHAVESYRPDELPSLFDDIQPDCALLLSAAPETFSYTLSELFSLGVPPIATDFGSFQERIEHGTTGLLIPPERNALVDAVSRLRSQPDLLAKLRKNIARMKLPAPNEMVQAYHHLLPASPLPESSYPLGPLHARELSHAALAHQITDAGNRATKLQYRLLELQQEFEHRSEWALQLERNLEDLRLQHARAVRTLDDTRIKAKQLERQKSELEASTSWKVTAPMRWSITHARSLPTGTVQSYRRWISRSRRLRMSLRHRGLRGTLKRAMEVWRPVPLLAPPDIEIPEYSFEPFELPAVESPEVSIIVPVHNQIEYTYRCIRVLSERIDERKISYEVIVVDDASTDNTAEVLKLARHLVYVRNSENLGFIGACNRGTEAARGKYFVFLNNDTVIGDGWLETLRDTYRLYDQVGLAGSKLIYPDGRLQEAGGLIFSDASGWNVGRFDDPSAPAFDYAREVHYCSGASIMIERDLFESLGRFDPRFAPAYYEDTDLAFKVRAAGKKVIYQPKSRVIHFEGVTCGTDLSRGIKRYQALNQEKFRTRWREQLARHPAPGQDVDRIKDIAVQRRILIIDACTPAPDQDSGSVRMLNMMRILQEIGFKVTFVPHNRVRTEPYTEDLQKRGIEVQYLPYLSSLDTFFTARGAEFDVILVSRYYIAIEYLGLIKKHAPQATVIFDTVDLHYLREQRRSQLENRAVRSSTAQRIKQEELSVIRQCDVTLVVSEYERATLAEELPDVRVEVLSNIHEVHPSDAPFEKRRDIMFIGGFEHPPNIDAAKWLEAEIFPLVRAQLPDVKLYIIGSKTPQAILDLAGEGIVVTGYVPDIEPYLHGCKMSVAPLRYGAGVKGKINTSMAHGLPVVATTPATEGMFLTDEHDVLVADNPHAFARAIVRLYQQEMLWKKLSDNGLRNVEEYFSFAAAQKAVCHILGLADGDPRGKDQAAKDLVGEQNDHR